MIRWVMVVSSGYYDDIRVQKLCKSVAQFSCVKDVEVIAAARPLPDHAQDLSEGVSRVRVRRLGNPPSEYAGKAMKALHRVGFIVMAAILALRMTKRGDVVHCHDLDVAAVGMVCKLLGRRFVFDSHEVYSGRPNMDRVSRGIAVLAERAAIRYCHILVCVSECARRHFMDRYGAAPPRSIVVTNSREAAGLPDLPAPRSRSDTAPFRVIYAGRFSLGRGLEALVGATRWLDEDVEITLMGWGPLKDVLEHSVQDEISGRAKLVFRPAVPLGEVVSVLREYDVGAVLTEDTCLNHALTVSNKLFEYSAAGLPTVVSKVCEHLRLASQYRYGIACEVTADKVAEAIDALRQDRDLYAACSRGAAQMARERSWENETAHLHEAVTEYLL